MRAPPTPTTRPGQRKLVHALAVLSTVALLLLVTPTVSAQGEPADGNTLNEVDDCKKDHAEDPLAVEYLCYISATLHVRETVGATGSLVVGGIVFGSLAIAIIGYLLILLFRITPKRIIKVKAVDGVQEVQAGQTANYEILVENIRSRRPVDVELALTKPPQGWSASMSVEKPLPSGFVELIGEEDTIRVELTAKRRKSHQAKVKVVITTPSDADPDQWSEIELTAVPFYKDRPRVRRARDAKIVTLVREVETVVRIVKVEHEPATIHPGDDVTSTVTVANEGAADAKNVPVTLTIDEEELGRTTIDVPREGEEAIAFKWTAPETTARVRVALK